MKRVLLAAVLAAVLLCLLAGPALAATTITVYPAGKTADMKHNADTVNIRNAFKAAIAAGPGSTVQLTAGHFYTNDVLVKGFCGTFRGAGESKTVIDCLRGLDPSLSPVAVNPDWGAFLFAFVGGQVTVSDMSCDITASSPTVGNILDGVTCTALGQVFQISGKESAAFERVNAFAGLYELEPQELR